jgi:hypothetical protein
VTESVDHLVVAAPDLATGVSRVEGLLGRRAVIGGRHPHPTSLQRILEAMGLHMRIDQADRSRLIASIRTDTGEVELSGYRNDPNGP